MTDGVSWVPAGAGGCGHSQADSPPAPLPVSNTGCSSAHTDTSFGTPPGYGSATDRAEEQRRHQDGLPYIDDSPSSSPHLGSKGRGSRDALAPGALESTKAVSPRAVGPVRWGLGTAPGQLSLSQRLPKAQPLAQRQVARADGASKVGRQVTKTPSLSLHLGRGDPPAGYVD